jgi:hypothetical protein
MRSRRDLPSSLEEDGTVELESDIEILLVEGNEYSTKIDAKYYHLEKPLQDAKLYTAAKRLT